MRSDLEELRSLTGLRGVAALLVVLVHTISVPSPTSFFAVFVWHGYLWVDMFLLLSGFVLLRTYEGAFQEIPSVAYRKFLVHRIVRIWPLFALVTVGTFFARQMGLTWYTDIISPWAWTLATNLLMMQAWVGQTSIDLPGWSVSGEWACCLLFPLLFRLLDRRRGGSAIGIYVAGFLILVGLSFSPIPQRGGALDLAFPETPLPVIRCVAEFSMGMALWRGSSNQLLIKILSLPLAEVAILGLALFMMGFRRTDLIVVLLFGLLIVCLSKQKGIVSKVLGNGPAHWAGLISYSVYLLQVPLIVLKGQSKLISMAQHMIKNSLSVEGRACWLALFYVLLVCCSAVMWQCVERPSRRLFRID